MIGCYHVIIFHVLSIKLTFSYIEKLKEIGINIPDKLFNQSVYFKINSGILFITDKTLYLSDIVMQRLILRVSTIVHKYMCVCIILIKMNIKFIVFIENNSYINYLKNYVFL